jgi:DNA-binding NarL/FixJ family response regulator
MQCILLSPDLMFSSRVLGAAKSIGLPLKIVPAITGLAGSLTAETRLLIIDLTIPALDLVQIMQSVREQSPSARVIAFGPHVDEAALAAAGAAGCEVMTRGQFQREYAALLQAAKEPTAG